MFFGGSDGDMSTLEMKEILYSQIQTTIRCHSKSFFRKCFGMVITSRVAYIYSLEYLASFIRRERDGGTDATAVS